MKQINLERLKDLVLARVSVGGTKDSHARADIVGTLQPLVARQLTQAEWEERFDKALGSLRAEGLIKVAAAPPSVRGSRKRAAAGPPSSKGRGKNAAASPSPRQGRGTRDAPGEPRFMSTPAGRRRLSSALGAKSLPRAKDWDEAKAKYLPRLAFGAVAEAQTGKVRPSVALLAQRLGVALAPTRTGRATPSRHKGRAEAELPPDMTTVVDTWLCKSLGVPARTKLSLDVIRGALLSKELGISVRALSTVVNIAAASLSGAASGDDAAVADALVSRWLFDSSPAPAPMRPPPAPRPASRVAAPVELVAARALQAAAGPDAHQYGPNKVFIGSVWRALADDPLIAHLGEAAFKQQLAEAHRRGLLKLGRADLVAAMDPGEVSASEIVHQNATYHFILRGASA